LGLLKQPKSKRRGEEIKSCSRFMRDRDAKIRWARGHKITQGSVFFHKKENGVVTIRLVHGRRPGGRGKAFVQKRHKRVNQSGRGRPVLGKSKPRGNKKENTL